MNKRKEAGKCMAKKKQRLFNNTELYRNREVFEIVHKEDSSTIDNILNDNGLLDTAISELDNFTQSTPAKDQINRRLPSIGKSSIKRKVKKSNRNRKKNFIRSNDASLSEEKTSDNIQQNFMNGFDDNVQQNDILLSKTVIEDTPEKCRNEGCDAECKLSSENKKKIVFSCNVEEDNVNYTQFFTDEIDNNMKKIISNETLFQSSIFENSNMDDQMLVDVNISEIVKSSQCKTDYPADTFYGLPMNVKQVLTQTRGIHKLYDWQNDCLCLQAIFKRQNMIYSLPTSGGKTLVAEILIMKELLINKKNVILVLPYVSIVQEKVRDLSPFAVQLGFHIEEYAASKGCIPPKKRRSKRSVYIGTIEKANAIVNSLIEFERAEELGMVVIDELHMIGEGGGRGALLEILLSKVLFKFLHVQIVGMSATLGNMDELKQFLKAEIYTNNFRPVELTEYVKIKDVIHQVFPHSATEEEQCKPVRTIAYPTGPDASLSVNDPDCVLPLVMEVIPSNSCLIFCPTKKNCQSVALMLCKSLPKEFANVKKDLRKQLLNTIQQTVNGVCEVLKSSVPFGIAYHHSGLTMDERKLIEEAYSSGVLCLLCCTSTLAAGVNLPAKRVIIRSPYVGNKFMAASQYKQMIGRAGRAGIDSSGESILMLPTKDKLKAKTLLSGLVGNCKSSLLYQDGKGVRELILSLLGLKICSSFSDIKEFICTTLFHVQQSDQENFNLIERIQKEIEHLTKLKLVKVKSEKCEIKLLETTDLGRATLKGCVDIDKAPFIYHQFKCAQKGLVLANELHLLYLATPLDQVEAVHLNWMEYYQQVNKLGDHEMKAAEFIGVTESVVCRKATGQRCAKVDEFVYKRFYLTLMLFNLMKKKSIWRIADTFNVARGFVQNLLSSTISFTSLLIHFTQELSEFWAFKLLFQVLVERLTHTNHIELAPLLDIPGVKQARASQLFRSGYRTLQDIAWTDPNKLSSQINHLPRRQAQLIISSAQMLLQEKIEALREEAEEISAAPGKQHVNFNAL